MVTDTAMDQVKRDLHRALDRMHSDLSRVEILSAALGAFSQPVPDYEPAFQHLHRFQHLHNRQLTEHELEDSLAD